MVGVHSAAGCGKVVVMVNQSIASEQISILLEGINVLREEYRDSIGAPLPFIDLTGDSDYMELCELADGFAAALESIPT